MSYHLAMATFRCLFAHRFVDTKISLSAFVRRGKGRQREMRMLQTIILSIETRPVGTDERRPSVRC